MKKALISLVSALVISLGGFTGAYAHGLSVILPDPGLTPNSTFYFFDRLGEALQEFFTFNPEAKAQLQVTFAAERIAEIKVLLETEGAKAKGLEVAGAALKANIARAASLIGDEKAKGKDVGELARTISGEFSDNSAALKDVFKDQKSSLEAKEDELKAKLKDARKAGDTAQVQALLQQLTALKAEKQLLETEGDKDDKDVEQEGEHLDEHLDIKDGAEKAINEAEKEKQELLAEAVKEGVTIPADAFTKFDRLLAQANELFDKGNYQGAKQLAKQAEKSLEKIADAAEDLYKANEKEQEMKDEKEFDGNDGAIEKSTRNSDLERAKEETNKAEEKLRGAGESKE